MNVTIPSRGRRRTGGLRAAGFAMLAVLGLLAAPAPAGAQDRDPLDPANFELRPNRLGDELKDRVAELDRELPNVGVQRVLADANRNAHQENGACNSAAIDPSEPPGRPEVAESFCFEPGDNDVRHWYPQGVTTVADAQDDQQWGSAQPVLISWYDHEVAEEVNPTDAEKHENGIEKGVRVTFLDKRTNAYRHVLLVYPVINSYGNPSYMSVRNDQDGGSSLHAGGIIWYGNHLYVADTARGFRVFDMRHIYDLGAASNGTTDDPDEIGRHDGTYYGHGYRYVMPQVASWTVTAANGEACSDDAMNFSYASLDRSGADHVVAGEYCNGKKGRVAAWKIADALDAHNEQITDPAHRWRADAVHALAPTNLQGAARFDGSWYLNRSRGEPESGENDNGVLHRTDTPGEPGAQEATPIGPEDLSLWRTPEGTDLWSVSEHPKRRMVYVIRVPTS